MKAVLGDTVIAEAPKEDLISIEGNWYFPPSSVNSEFLTESATPYTCPWKGEASYFSVAGLENVVWSYEHPFETVREIAGHLSFYPAVTVEQV